MRDKITHTVNSLLNALALPDETTEANQVLRDLHFPQFSRILPYRDYDAESGLFINADSIGFMLEAMPLMGANEQIVLTLENLIRTKLPRNVPLSVHLVSNKLVGDAILHGLAPSAWKGQYADKFNAITQAYYLRAAQQRFSLKPGLDLPMTLRDYRLYFSYSVPIKKKAATLITEITHLIKVLRATLEGARIPTRLVSDQEFVQIVGEMINHDPQALFRQPRRFDPYQDLNYQCVDNGFDLKVYPEHLKIGLRQPGCRQASAARVMNFTLEHNPEMAFLWSSADNYSNILYPELSITCPFIITLTLMVEDQVKTQQEANLKFIDLERKNNTSYAKFFPQVGEQVKEWGQLRQKLGSGQTALVSYYFNVTTFCDDDDNQALEYEQQVINCFLKNGLRLISPRFHHMRHFLANFPFMAGEGLFKDLQSGGVVHRAESVNVVNLMPVVADTRLSLSGLLSPTYRHQLAFIDLFNSPLENTNYNMAVAGTSGAGKTGLIQPVIRSVIDSGGHAWVFDMGDGYKSLCENMGGIYLNAENLKFNPFANIIDIDRTAERVRDQLSVMASPNGNLDEVHEGLLLQAVKYAWLTRNRQARIDDVVDFLKKAKVDTQYAQSAGIQNRLDEMIILLDQYTAGGIYGEFFNSSEPSLQDEANMVVLELGDLEERPSLLVAVMFSLIIYIENRMYQSSREQKKLCVIDEGWKLLDFKNKKVGDFIEKGYRTARRHTGSYITITQNIEDFDAPTASSAARAAWSCSSYKGILKQSSENFDKYTKNCPDHFNRLEKSVVKKFGSAKDQWFSSFLLRVEGNTSWHRLFVDPLSRAMYSSDGKDFQFIQQRRAEGVNLHEAIYQLAKRNFATEMAELETWAARYLPRSSA
ncbi:type IV secretion system protein TraC [Arsenophonus nasoniae]|uniref:Type IV secretion system protein TraC n=1 Tax=Arsenophonus nasoniae TaxID=638 RepID=A0AA95GVG3_9GAMM|nr:type IV secretion system protein TraC [Arsenophonus nasoniae]WGM03634.1 type IV secretion system protein TraC [Arsenophonus nasoniae]